ncbi:hypothetical protein ABFU82_09565 [Nocardioides sp. WV_118_6]
MGINDIGSVAPSIFRLASVDFASSLGRTLMPGSLEHDIVPAYELACDVFEVPPGGITILAARQCPPQSQQISDGEHVLVLHDLAERRVLTNIAGVARSLSAVEGIHLQDASTMLAHVETLVTTLFGQRYAAECLRRSVDVQPQIAGNVRASQWRSAVRHLRIRAKTDPSEVGTGWPGDLMAAASDTLIAFHEVAHAAAATVVGASLGVAEDLDLDISCGHLQDLLDQIVLSPWAEGLAAELTIANIREDTVREALVDIAAIAKLQEYFPGGGEDWSDIDAALCAVAAVDLARRLAELSARGVSLGAWEALAVDQAVQAAARLGIGLAYTWNQRGLAPRSVPRAGAAAWMGQGDSVRTFLSILDDLVTIIEKGQRGAVYPWILAPGNPANADFPYGDDDFKGVFEGHLDCSPASLRDSCSATLGNKSVLGVERKLKRVLSEIDSKGI